MGPVEYLVVEFPGNKFKGDLVPALRELTQSGTIRVIDLIFIKKDAAGNMTSFELSNLPAEEAALFNGLVGEIDDLLNQDDILITAQKLQPNSSATLVVFEHAWATQLRDAVINAGGHVVDNDRIPAAVIDAAYAAAKAA